MCSTSSWCWRAIFGGWYEASSDLHVKHSLAFLVEEFTQEDAIASTASMRWRLVRIRVEFKGVRTLCKGTMRWGSLMSWDSVLRDCYGLGMPWFGHLHPAVTWVLWGRCDLWIGHCLLSSDWRTCLLTSVTGFHLGVGHFGQHGTSCFDAFRICLPNIP